MADDSTPPPAAPAADDSEAPEPAYEARGLGLADALAKDADDAALARYKAALLGGATTTGGPRDAETRRVVIHEVALEAEGRPDIVLPLDSATARQAAAATRIVVKEGATTTLRVRFSVHNEVVLALKWSNVVTRLGVPVDRDALVLGAYAPRAEQCVGVAARGVQR